MSDALVNRRTLEQPSADGQVERVSDKSQSGTDGQPSDDGQVDKAQANIKALQSKLDSQIAASKREAEAARREAQEARQFAQQLQQRLQQVEDSAAPDDYTRLELRAKRAEEAAAQYAAAYQQTLEAQRKEAEKLAILQEIAEEFDLVTAKDLEATASTIEATKLAIKLQAERERNKQQLDDDKQTRNAPDVGGGGPITSVSKWEAAYQAAVKARDSHEQIRLLREQPRGK